MVGGYQATLTLRCLDGDWQDAAFVGEVCLEKNAAEHSAAAVACELLRGDDQLKSRRAFVSEIFRLCFMLFGFLEAFKGVFKAFLRLVPTSCQLAT